MYKAQSYTVDWIMTNAVLENGHWISWKMLTAFMLSMQTISVKNKLFQLITGKGNHTS